MPQYGQAISPNAYARILPQIRNIEARTGRRINASEYEKLLAATLGADTQLAIERERQSTAERLQQKRLDAEASGARASGIIQAGSAAVIGGAAFKRALAKPATKPAVDAAGKAIEVAVKPALTASTAPAIEAPTALGPVAVAPAAAPTIGESAALTALGQGSAPAAAPAALSPVAPAGVVPGALPAPAAMTAGAAVSGVAGALGIGFTAGALAKTFIKSRTSARVVGQSSGALGGVALMAMAGFGPVGMAVGGLLALGTAVLGDKK